MQRNYFTEKENPYRFGVLQGNYIEELYAKDFERNQTVTKYFPTTEMQSNFQRPIKIDQKEKKVSFRDENKEELDVNIEDGDRNDQEVKPESETPLTNNSVCKEDQEVNENLGKTNEIENQFYQQNCNVTNVPQKKLSLNDKNCAKRTISMLNRGNSIEEEEREEKMKMKIKKNKEFYRYISSYNMDYDYHVKPQIYTQNDWRGEKKTKDSMIETVKQHELLEIQKLEAEQKKVDQALNYSKRNQNFTKTFDKPHISIGFRN